MEHKRVFVVGYMGVGKSTSGSRLARFMDLPFLGTDAELRRRHDCSINALFDQLGEDGFRTLERDLLRELVAAHPRVLISTGGGMPCHGDNMAFMREHGTVVYLQMPAADLVERLRGRADQRPLIAGIPEDNLPAFVAKHLADREDLYGRAHITVDARHFDGDRMKSVRSLIEGRMGFNP